MSSWGSAQEELLRNLELMGFNPLHARSAITTNPGTDLFVLIDWMGRNPSPYATAPSSSSSIPSAKSGAKEDEQLARLVKEEAESKKRTMSSLQEMGFSYGKIEQAMTKLPGASEGRLIEWLSDPKNQDKKDEEEPWVMVDQAKKKTKKGPPSLEVGSRVRVKSTISDPTHGWGSVSIGDLGIVKRIEKGHDIWVDFPKQPEWHGVYEEMEVVEEEEEEEEPGSGQAISPVSPAFSDPKLEVMQIEDEVESLKLNRAVVVGSRVRVKKTVSTPVNGWGAVRHGDVGIVAKIDSLTRAAYVDFLLQKGWKAEVIELEPAEEETSDLKVKTPPLQPSVFKELKSPPAPMLSRQESEDALRKFLEEDRKTGKLLTLEEMNFLLLKDHKPSDTYNCTVCYDDSLNLDKIFVLTECRHHTCVTCMTTHIVTQMKAAKVSLIRCPEIDCQLMVTFSEVKRCIPEKDFLVFQQLLLEDSLKKDPSCRWCPRPGCGTAMMAMPNPKNPMMRCPKEDCKFAFCAECKEAWHSDATCEQYQAWKLENSEADKRYATWASKNTKPCPSCKAAIQKNAGCNHMKCINCRHEFCWLCMKSVVGSGGKYTPGHWALDERSPCYQKMHT